MGSSAEAMEMGRGSGSECDFYLSQCCFIQEALAGLSHLKGFCVFKGVSAKSVIKSFQGSIAPDTG